ncbi:MAG: amidohydrolase family protein [Pseudomonadales bacterium]
MSGTPARADLLIENATILTMAQGDDEVLNGFMLVKDGRIVAIGNGSPPGSLRESIRPESVIDATGRIVMPGFVSGHNHLWQSAFRGIAANGELYPWLEALHWTFGQHFQDGDMYAFTLHGALDHLSKGITTTYNHAQRLETDEEQYLESFDASVAAGHHFVFAYNANLNQTAEKISADVKSFVRLSQERGGKQLLGISLNAVGAHTRDAAKLALEMSLAEQHGMTAQIHYLEQYSRRFSERRLWSSFLAAGAVAPNVSYAHFIHTTDKIVADTANRGGAMIWNPLSNGRLASGLPDILGYREAGVRVGMGVDGAASADIADPFENMRMGLYALRMQYRNAGVMQPMEMLRLHTLDTAEILGVDKHTGSLEEGKSADFLIVDPRYPLTGPVTDSAATLVFACSAANIDEVYVAGQLRVKDGLPVGHDVSALSADVEARIARIRSAARRASGQD